MIEKKDSTIESSPHQRCETPFRFFWVTPELVHWQVFIGTGILGAIAHLCLIQAFERAQASLLAPFNYSKLLWGILLGYLFFDQLPTLNTLAGCLLIIAAGLYVFSRESKDFHATRPDDASA